MEIDLKNMMIHQIKLCQGAFEMQRSDVSTEISI